MREIDKSNPKTFIETIAQIFYIKKPLYKNWWIYLLLLLLFFFFTIGIPIIINESYKVDKGYITLWGALEVLSFYAVILSGLITIGALIVTIYHSKKATEKQLKFYMSQTKAPFFVIEQIHQKGSAQEFQLNDEHFWSKKYNVSTAGKLNAKECGLIEIVLKNIGDGIALMPSYQVDMFASTIIPEHIIGRDSRITLTYDLQKNLNDKWIKYFFDKKMQEHAGGFVELYTYVKLSYKNALGVEFRQELKMSIGLELEKHVINLIVNEASPQEVLL